MISSVDEQEVRECLPWRFAGNSFPPLQEKSTTFESTCAVQPTWHLSLELVQRFCHVSLYLQVDYANEHKRQFGFQWWYWSYEITIIVWSFILCVLNIGNFFQLYFFREGR